MRHPELQPMSKHPHKRAEKWCFSRFRMQWSFCCLQAIKIYLVTPQWNMVQINCFSLQTPISSWRSFHNSWKFGGLPSNSNLAILGIPIPILDYSHKVFISVLDSSSLQTWANFLSTLTMAESHSTGIKCRTFWRSPRICSFSQESGIASTFVGNH